MHKQDKHGLIAGEHFMISITIFTLLSLTTCPLYSMDYLHRFSLGGWYGIVNRYWGETPEPPIFSWVKNPDDSEQVRIYLENGSDPNLEKKYCGTLLQIAVDKGNRKAIELLLKHGADSNKINDYTSRTPLAIACRHNNHPLVLILLQNKAHINSKGNSDKTPLAHTLPFYDGRNQLAVIKTLLLWGANPYIRNNHGRSILNIIDNQASKYIKQKQKLLINLVTKLLSRGTVKGVKIPDDIVHIIVSYCYPTA